MRGPLLPVALTVVAFSAYCLYSIEKHLKFRSTGYDLGIFEQAVRNYAHLHWPYSDLKGSGYNLIGDHFHPVLLLLAPVYRLFPSPITLLVVQAAALSLSVFRIALTAQRELASPVGGAFIGIAYAFSWGVQGAVAFDFHPVVLAAPVIAVCIDNIFRQRFRRAALYAASLALIKEELILIIIPIGLVIAIFYHRRKTGFLLAAGGAVALFIVTLVIIPAVNYHGRYDYWSSAGIVGGDGFASGMWHTVTHSFTNAVTPMGKLWNTVLLALPTVFVCLYSPITLAVVPVVLWHLASPNPVYSGTSGHYAVALMPIVFLGAVDAIRRLHERGRAPTVVRLIPAMVGLIALVFFVSANPFRAMLHPGWWHRPRYAIAGAAALERVPDHVTVAVDNNLAPHLTGRDDVHLFAVGMRDSTGQIADVEWVVTNVAVGAFPNQPADRLKLVGKLQRCGYRKVARNLGFVVLHRTVDLGRTGLVTCLAADVPTGQ